MGRDAGHPGAEAAHELGSVSGELRAGFARSPAALVLKRLRKIPVIERHVRGNALRVERVEQTAVEGPAFLVPGSFAERLDTRPGDRETIGLDAQFGEQRDVLFDAVVVVAGDVTVVAAGDLARSVGEAIPDRFSSSRLRTAAPSIW